MKDYSVCLFSRPLMYAMLSPPVAASSEGMHHLSHWGVLVTEMSMIDLTVILSRRMWHNPNENYEFGIMYELHQGENRVNTLSINNKFGMKSIRNEWRRFSMHYVGKTTMTHDAIKAEAIQIINTHPDYHIFENNCQNFAKYLLETICPDSTIPKTITEVLQSLKNIRNLTRTLPGAYPCSIESADNDSFETASGTYWFTSTETVWITARDYSLISVKGTNSISTLSNPINEDTGQSSSITTREFSAIQRPCIGRTTLINAGQNGDIEGAITLLDLKIDTEINDKSDQMVLQDATYNGHKDIVELLGSKNMDDSAANNDGWTMMHRAAWGGHKEIVELLVSKGGDVRTMDMHGWTSLHGAAWKGHKDVVELLVSKGADIGAVDKVGQTAFHRTALAGHKDVVELLVGRGGEVGAVDDYGWTALHGAAWGGHKDVVEVLVSKGADAGAVYMYGWDGAAPRQQGEKTHKTTTKQLGNNIRRLKKRVLVCRR